MFSYNLSPKLRKRVAKLAKKDPVLARVFKKKIREVISQDTTTIDTYKNLRSPQNEFKRIHLTGSHVLIFAVDKSQQHIVFVDLVRWDKAYK